MSRISRLGFVACVLTATHPALGTAQDTLAHPSPEERASAPPSAAAKQRVTRLAAQRAQMESSFAARRAVFRRYARLGPSDSPCGTPTDSLVRVTSNAWPDATVVSYAFAEDSTGRVLHAVETPTSCSGDWVISYSYFFDAAGRTTVFERYSGFFNGCDFGVAHEISTYYYDTSGTLLTKDYALTDSAHKARPPVQCQFMYHQPYAVYSSWRAYARGAKVPARP